MLFLHGLGHFHPENVITNRFLEELDIETSEQWILERVGVHTRRTVLPLEYIKTTKNCDPRAALEANIYSNAQTGALACRMALERAGVDVSEIGLVISGCSAPDNVSPAEASTIAAELGIDVPCFDLSSACTSFGMQINLLSRLQPGSVPEFILVVNPENLTRSVNYSDRRTAPLFGDGTSAAVVSTSVPSRLAFEYCRFESKPTAWQKVTIPRMGFFRQDGNAVQGFAIRKTSELLRYLQELYSVNSGRLKFIGHQANMGMLKTVCERCGILESNHWHNVVHFGNTASASAPTVLSQNWEALVPGTHIAVVLVGAGLSWVSLMLKVKEAD